MVEDMGAASVAAVVERARAGAARLGCTGVRSARGVMFDLRHWLVQQPCPRDRTRWCRRTARRARMPCRGAVLHGGSARLLGEERARSTWPTSACKTRTRRSLFGKKVVVRYRPLGCSA